MTNVRLLRSTAFGVLLSAAAAAASPLEFHVSYSKNVTPGPFSGRLYVMMTKGRTSAEPRRGPNWFRPGPMFALDVTNVRPGEAVKIGANAVSFPAPLSKLPKGEYTFQAVLDLNQGDRDFSAAPGNGYSSVRSATLDPESGGPVAIVVDKVVTERPFRETDRVKLVELRSPSVSAFRGRDVVLKAAVVLPPSFAASPERKYPILFEIPGFGGTHRNVGRWRDFPGAEFLYVVLNPDCTLGHHVFADSANNGPYGKALTEELIPHIEKKFRAIGKPSARFLTGHSSGGWSSLWLQVAYPDFFGGVWSTAPDPVDFRDFQQIDVYRPGENMFKDANGKPRPIARQGETPILFYKSFSDMEEVMGHGGQLASFEAVFSPKGSDGAPRKLWDRTTGAIDLETAKAWQKYDIRLKLEREWPEIGPKLAGKIHVYMGGLDTFYLDGAAKLLKESLEKLHSDAVVEIFPGLDHGTVMTASLMNRMKKEMVEALRKSHPAD